MIKLACDDCVYAFSKDNKPALRIKSGDIVEIQTMDCFAGQLISETDKLSEIDFDRINPITGPIYIEGAREGDTLKVTIEKIETGDRGVMCTGAGQGVLGDIMEGFSEKIVGLDGNYAFFSDKLKLLLNKMIGVIGVAPKDGEASSRAPGSHGGNMDNKMITEKAAVYFPVFTDGAFFALGDVHAAMGDGEVGGSGIEVPAQVTVKLEIVNNIKLVNPFVENENFISTVASALRIEDAVHTAVYDMDNLLKGKLTLCGYDRSMLLSAVGNVEICQVINSLKTVRFNVPKRIGGFLWVS